MFSKGFFYILPTLLVFTEGKVTESFINITASALKVSELASVRHAYGYKMIYLDAIIVNVRSVTNGGFCLYKTENYCQLCNVWRTKILLVVNVGSLEKRSNQPKYKETRTRSPKTTAKLI